MTTRTFRGKATPEVSKSAGPVLKQYQAEVDRLTRRCSTLRRSSGSPRAGMLARPCTVVTSTSSTSSSQPPVLLAEQSMLKLPSSSCIRSCTKPPIPAQPSAGQWRLRRASHRSRCASRSWRESWKSSRLRRETSGTRTPSSGNCKSVASSWRPSSVARFASRTAELSQSLCGTFPNAAWRRQRGGAGARAESDAAGKQHDCTPRDVGRDANSRAASCSAAGRG